MRPNNLTKTRVGRLIAALAKALDPTPGTPVEDELLKHFPFARPGTSRSRAESKKKPAARKLSESGRPNFHGGPLRHAE